MRCCKRCYRVEGREVPVTEEDARAGHRAFRCRWCGTLSGEAVSVLDGATSIVDIGTVPPDRWSDKLYLSEL